MVLIRRHLDSPLGELPTGVKGHAAGIDPIDRLVGELSRLPGVGGRTALRLAFYLLKQARNAGRSGALALDLASALSAMVNSVRICSRCHNFCAAELCDICADGRRNASELCVVEGVADLRAIDSTGVWRGRFYVLHGALAPLDGVGPEQLGLGQLRALVAAGGIKEVVVATSADVEGDATALYLSKLLAGLGVAVTRLASGIPIGGELEYIDAATLSRALTMRSEF